MNFSMLPYPLRNEPGWLENCIEFILIISYNHISRSKFSSFKLQKFLWISDSQFRPQEGIFRETITYLFSGWKIILSSFHQIVIIEDLL